MRGQFLTPPVNLGLTTIQAVNDEMLLTTGAIPTRDAWIGRKIGEASDLIEAAAGKRLARARIIEPLTTTGGVEVFVDRTPIVAVNRLTYADGQDVDQDPLSMDDQDDPGDYHIDDAEAGALVLDTGWFSSMPQTVWLERRERNERARRDYRIDYWGGYLLPSDNLYRGGMTCTAAGQVITVPSGAMPLLVSGDRITLAGFQHNSGIVTVQSVDGLAITVFDSIADDAGGPNTSLVVQTLPPRWERYAIETVKSIILRRAHDDGVQTERLADWSATWSSGRAGGTDVVTYLPPSIAGDIDRRERRLV